MSTLLIPTDIKTHELSNSIVWIEDDILFSKPKPGPFIHSTREIMLEDLHKFKQITGGKKMCMIIEGHPQAETPPKEDRDFISDKLSEVTKAMAILTPSAVSRMVANLFFLFKPAPYPMKMFVNVSDAKAWLQDCLKRKNDSIMI
ncbi:MAG: hypothetical protein K0S32_3593 [Bacteroidetes bacterium]|jgi:hypothetical protein|nr:hypothetical protein [Bacteroidota bacterium]